MRRSHHRRTGVRPGTHPWARHALRAGLAAIAVTGMAGAAHAAPRFGDSTWVAPNASTDSLTFDAGPRVAPPDHARAWETALRTPFRIAFFPLRLVADGLEWASDLAVPHFLELEPGIPKPTGPRLVAQAGVSGLTDVAVGPGVTWRDFMGPSSLLHAGATLSTRDRRAAELRATLGLRRPVGFVLRALYDSKPNTEFFGIGNAAPRADVSYYLLENTNVGGTLLAGTAPHRQLRLFGGYSSLSPRRGYFGSPLLEDVFPPDAVPFEHQATRELFYGAGADLGALDDARDPSLGVHGRADLERNHGVRASDPDFDRWRLEARGYLPVFARWRVLAARIVYTGVDPRGATTILPFDRLATNDGTLALAGYPSHRFTDRQLALGRIEYRWVLIDKVSAILLHERVEVAPTRADFKLDAAHATWGGGLRYAPSESKVLRLEAGKSHDGLHVALRLGSDW